MRRPKRTKGRRVGTTHVQSVSAPIGGWNTRDPLAAMHPADAVELTNFFPTPTDCVLRKGTSAYSTGITGTTETLAVYNRQNGTDAMFAASSSEIYDVSSSGTATAQSLTVTNGQFEYLNFSDGTNHWLIMVNGVDKPQYFDGTSWTAVDSGTSPALTGLTSTSIANVAEYNGRLFFIEKDSLSFWYLAAGAAGGALTEFDLGSFASKGGSLLWMDTWTRDGGDGPDDVAVFMTTEGQAIVYTGTNPSAASTWARVGTYQLAKPLSKRSHIKFGGDLIALTQNGAFPLSAGLKEAQTNEKTAVTDKIEKSFNDASLAYKGNFGWEITHFPAESALIFNVPIASSTGQEQYVMNTITKSWCKFDSWDAQCFAVFNDELYFGGSTIVTKAWIGTDDLGNDIIGVGKAAFTNFGDSNQKRFNMYRPMLQVNGDITFLTDIDVDFVDSQITGEATYTVTSGAKWDDADWDVGYWASSLEVVRQWTSPAADIGTYCSGTLKVNTNALEIHWIASEYIYETGDIVT